MPELPEVETVRRGVTPHLQDQTIQQLQVRQRQLRWPIPEGLEQQVAGQTIQQITRRAKYLILHLATGQLIFHLGMSGSLRILPEAGPAGKHDHVDLVLANGRCLRYNDPRRFGALLWNDTASPLNQHSLLNKLGPEPLSAAFNGEYLYAQSRNRRIAIKQFIMDNRVVVGMGNIYANEALFSCGINPQRKTDRLARQRYLQLAEEIKTTLAAAIEQGGTTLRDFTQSDGKPGHFAQALQVYGNAGEACPRCCGTIRQIR